MALAKPVAVVEIALEVVECFAEGIAIVETALADSELGVCCCCVVEEGYCSHSIAVAGPSIGLHWDRRIGCCCFEAVCALA